MLVLIAIIFFGNILYAQANKRSFNTDSLLRVRDSLKKTMIGKPYPDFEHTGDDGTAYSKKILSGKKYYINFWFEGCHPCMEEMSLLIQLNNELQNTHREFISFTFESPSDIKRIRKERGLNFKIIPISKEECYRLNLNNGFPMHIVVNEKGNIEYVGTYDKSNANALKEITAILLNENKAQ